MRQLPWDASSPLSPSGSVIRPEFRLLCGGVPRSGSGRVLGPLVTPLPELCTGGARGGSGACGEGGGGAGQYRGKPGSLCPLRHSGDTGDHPAGEGEGRGPVGGGTGEGKPPGLVPE